MKIIKAIPNSYLGIKGDGDQEILKQFCGMENSLRGIWKMLIDKCGRFMSMKN